MESLLSIDNGTGTFCPCRPGSRGGRKGRGLAPKLKLYHRWDEYGSDFEDKRWNCPCVHEIV